MTALAERLTELDGASQIRMQPAVSDGRSVVFAHVSHDATDQILVELRALSVAPADMTLMRIEELGGGVPGADDTSLIWADVVGLAGSNSRLIGRYLVFMAVAGVTAGHGVVDANPILIVGAMAVSPDLLPVTSSRSCRPGSTSTRPCGGVSPPSTMRRSRSRSWPGPSQRTAR